MIKETARIKGIYHQARKLVYCNVFIENIIKKNYLLVVDLFGLVFWSLLLLLCGLLSFLEMGFLSVSGLRFTSWLQVFHNLPSSDP